MCHHAETIELPGISDSQALVLGRLLASVWPKPDKGPPQRAAKLQAIGAAYQGPAEQQPLSHVVFEGEIAIAQSTTFARTVQTSDGDLTVLALAMVASAPDRRGEGLGALIVRAAFDRVDSGAFPCSLFQTSFAVRPFYERLGCQLVENPIRNSKNESDPNANPFWDDVVMRYPSDLAWPTGDIDLNGDGY